MSELDIAIKALKLIALETEDILPPLRYIPRGRMVEIATKALNEILRNNNKKGV